MIYIYFLIPVKPGFRVPSLAGSCETELASSDAGKLKDGKLGKLLRFFA